MITPTPPLQPEALAPRATRVVFEHSPALFTMHYVIDSDFPISIAKDGHTFYRAKSTPRWVLYRQAVRGHRQRDRTVTLNDNPDHV